MHIQEIRALSDENLRKEQEETYRELMNLRFRIAARQLAKTSAVRETKRKLARLKTVGHERELTRGVE